MLNGEIGSVGSSLSFMGITFAIFKSSIRKASFLKRLVKDYN